MLSLITKTFAGRGLDKRFPALHKFYISLYNKIQPNQIKTASIPLKCQLSYDPKQAGVGFYLDNFGKFETTTTKTILDHIKTNQTIIDIGANIGYYTILTAEKTGPKGKVIAIEPESKNIKQLKENITLNNLKNIIVLPQAISDKNGKIKLYLSPTSSGEHSITTKTKKSITISTTTLDNLVKNKNLKPSLIKIDTEGAEHQILKGGLKTIKKFHPTLVFEYSNRTDKQIFDLNQLLKLKYKLFQINEKQKKIQPITVKEVNQKLQTQSYLNLLTK